MQQANEARIDDIVELAVTGIPLDEIAAGPSTSHGMGPEWRPHQALDFVVHDVKRFPGKGWPLIRADLQPPLIRNRNMAVNALRAWGQDSWPAEAMPLLEHARELEPDPKVRDRLSRLILDEREPEPTGFKG